MVGLFDGQIVGIDVILAMLMTMDSMHDVDGTDSTGFQDIGSFPLISEFKFKIDIVFIWI